MFSSVTFTTYIYLRNSHCKVGDGFSNLKSWVSAHPFSSSRLSLLRSHLASEFFNLFSSFNFLQLIVNVTEQSICFRLEHFVELSTPRKSEFAEPPPTQSFHAFTHQAATQQWSMLKRPKSSSFSKPYPLPLAPIQHMWRVNTIHGYFTQIASFLNSFLTENNLS